MSYLPHLQDTSRTVSLAEAQELALEAEERAQPAPTQDERDYWLRLAAHWWERA